jgi:hypothetical protein
VHRKVYGGRRWLRKKFLRNTRCTRVVRSRWPTLIKNI